MFEKKKKHPLNTYSYVVGIKNTVLDLQVFIAEL